MITICVTNNKGGVGKTTTCSAVAACLQLKGYKVLAIDMDPQSNLGLAAGVDIRVDKTTAQVLEQRCTLQEAIQHGKICDICPAPADSDLAGIDMALQNKLGKEFRMKEAIASLPKDAYDFILLDTTGELGLLSINAMVAADYVLIPTLAEPYSVMGTVQVFDVIDDVRKYNFNPQLKTLGVVVNLYNPRLAVQQDNELDLCALCAQRDVPVFYTRIHEASAIAKAQGEQENPITYVRLSKNRAARDFIALTDEILQELRLPV